MYYMTEMKTKGYLCMAISFSNLVTMALADCISNANEIRKR